MNIVTRPHGPSGGIVMTKQAPFLYPAASSFFFLVLLPALLAIILNLVSLKWIPKLLLPLAMTLTALTFIFVIVLGITFSFDIEPFIVMGLCLGIALFLPAFPLIDFFRKQS